MPSAVDVDDKSSSSSDPLAVINRLKNMDLDEYHKYVRMHLTLKLDLSDANLEAFMGVDKEKKSLLNNVLGVLGASKSKGKSV